MKKYNEYWINKSLGVHEVDEPFYVKIEAGMRKLEHIHVIDISALEDKEDEIKKSHDKLKLENIWLQNMCQHFRKMHDLLADSLEIKKKRSLHEKIEKLEQIVKEKDRNVYKIRSCIDIITTYLSTGRESDFYLARQRLISTVERLTVTVDEES